MVDSVHRSGWLNGINNRTNSKGLAQGEVRDSVNLDALPGGQFGLRAGFVQVAGGVNVRGVLSLGDTVLIADGTNLRAYDSATNSEYTLSTSIAPAGRFAGAVWNEELFFCTENASFRYKEGVLRDWGVTTVSSQPVPLVVGGGLLVGEYQAAVTFVDAWGAEGGTVNPIVITVPAGSGLLFHLPTPPAGGLVRLYVGTVQGSTLYRQYQGAGGGDVYVSTIADQSARLMTLNRRAPAPGDFISEHNGVLATADGKVLWLSEPFRPHLRSMGKRFFSFAAPIGGVVSAHGGLFILADKTYYLSKVETQEPELSTVLPYEGVHGTMMVTPDNKAVWMTKYGLARSTGPGQAELLSALRFLPQQAIRGQSGLIEHNGNQLLVTTMHRAEDNNPLRASDYYEAEIVTP